MIWQDHAGLPVITQWVAMIYGVSTTAHCSHQSDPLITPLLPTTDLPIFLSVEDEIHISIIYYRCVWEQKGKKKWFKAWNSNPWNLWSYSQLKKIAVNCSHSCLSGEEKKKRFTPNKSPYQGEGKYEKYLVGRFICSRARLWAAYPARHSAHWGLDLSPHPRTLLSWK